MLQISTYALMRFWIRFRGLFLFLFFMVFPIFLTTSIKQLAEEFYRYQDWNFSVSIFSKSTFYFVFMSFVFFALFFIYTFSPYSKERLVRKANWFVVFANSLIPALLAFFLGFGIIFGIHFLAELLFPPDHYVLKWLTESNQGYVELFTFLDRGQYLDVFVILSYVIIIGPVIEEILFRGYLQDFTQKILPLRWLSVGVTAFVFGLFHFNSLSNALFAFLVGIVLSVFRMRQKSINMTICMHGIINFLGIVYGLLGRYIWT